MLSFCIGFPCFFGVLDGYARCLLSAVDLKVSSRGFATFREKVRGKRHMLRDSAFRCARQMSSLTDDGLAMTPRLVEGCPVPVMESILEFRVAQAIEIERERGSVWESFFGLASEVNSTSRLRLSLMAEQVCRCEFFEDTISHWQSGKQFLPSTEALDSMLISG